jgi:hypothetical protein
MLTMEIDAKTVLILSLLFVVMILGYLAISGAMNKPTVVTKTQSAPITSSATDALTKGSYWACNGFVCNRMRTPQEWVNRNCVQNNNQVVCKVTTSQGDMAFPIEALNLSAIKECAEYLCVQEVMVRNASYTFSSP